MKRHTMWIVRAAGILLPAVVVLLAGCGGSGAPGLTRTHSAPEGRAAMPDHVPGEVLVKFKAGTSAGAVAAADRAAGAQPIRTFATIGVRHVGLREGVAVPAALRAYQQDPNVLYAEPNYIVYADATPNDPYFYRQWGLHNIGQLGGTPDADIDAPETWDVTTGSESIIVAVIDTGVDYTHEDLQTNMWVNPGEVPDNQIDDDGNGYVDDVYGFDFCTWEGKERDSDPMDDHRHGSHCAGIIGAVGDNGVGIAGVNWTVQIMALKFLSSTGWGNTADAIACVEYATMMKDRGYPIAVLSNSWGGGGYSWALDAAIAAAGDRDILFVAAAGNSGRNTDGKSHYPSCYDLDNIISVAASDRNDNLASFSNYGAKSVDLAAPGVGICSTVLNDEYISISGTSMACPHVAGTAALLKTYTGESGLQVKERILAAVDPMAQQRGKPQTLSGGRLNLYSALSSTGPPPAETGTMAGTVYDSQGGPVKQATVTASAGSPVASTKTNGRGRYTLELPAGEYTVEASKDNLWGEYPQPVVVVAGGQTTGIDIVVQVQ